MTKSQHMTALAVRAFVIFLVLAYTQAMLESDRWWSSPSIVSALGISSEQSATIEQLYEQSLEARRHASEEVMELTGQITELILARVFDEQLLHLTEKLTKARYDQGELSRRMFDLAAQTLTPEQREMATHLSASKMME